MANDLLSNICSEWPTIETVYVLLVAQQFHERLHGSKLGHGSLLEHKNHMS
jgi:hypothetical protein